MSGDAEDRWRKPAGDPLRACAENGLQAGRASPKQASVGLILVEPTVQCLEDLTAEPHRPVSHQLLQFTLPFWTSMEGASSPESLCEPTQWFFNSWSQSFTVSAAVPVFTELLLLSICGFYSKLCTQIVSFNLHEVTTRNVFLLSPYSRSGNSGTRRSK